MSKTQILKMRKMHKAQNQPKNSLLRNKIAQQFNNITFFLTGFLSGALIFTMLMQLFATTGIIIALVVGIATNIILISKVPLSQKNFRKLNWGYATFNLTMILIAIIGFIIINFSVNNFLN